MARAKRPGAVVRLLGSSGLVSVLLLAGCGGAGFTSMDLDPHSEGGGGGEASVASSSSGGIRVASSSSGGSNGDGDGASPSAPDSAAGTDAGGSTEPGEAGPDAVSSSPDSPSFDPGSLSGLALWLDAARGVTAAGGAVSAWLDRTSHHNDASQATAAEQPSLHAGAVNGWPAVHFDNVAGGASAGDMMTIADSASLQWGTGDFYLVLVARFDNTLANGPESGVGVLYSKTSPGSSLPGPLLTANIIGALSSNQLGLAGSTSSASGDWVLTHTAYNDGTPHAFALQRRGTTLDLRVDGVSIVTSTTSDPDVSGAGAPVRIGGDANGQAIRLDGDVAEVIAVAGPLATADRANLEAFLASKYGL